MEKSFDAPGNFEDPDSFNEMGSHTYRKTFLDHNFHRRSRLFCSASCD